MIQDEDVVIAENPVVALWTRAKEACSGRIKDLENTLIIERAFLEMATNEIAKNA